MRCRPDLAIYWPDGRLVCQFDWGDADYVQEVIHRLRSLLFALLPRCTPEFFSLNRGPTPHDESACSEYPSTDRQPPAERARESSTQSCCVDVNQPRKKRGGGAVGDSDYYRSSPKAVAARRRKAAQKRD